jgi:hypothetical protein
LSRTRSFGNVILYCPLFSTILIGCGRAARAGPRSVVSVSTEKVI